MKEQSEPVERRFPFTKKVDEDQNKDSMPSSKTLKRRD